MKKKIWLWYWGILDKHSPEKIEFTDFDEMKAHSAKHSKEHSWLSGLYWSNYETKDFNSIIDKEEVAVAPN